MKAEVKDNSLVITIPLQPPSPSASGKTLTVATTHGFVRTSATLDGLPISLSLNAFVRPTDRLTRPGN